MSEATSTTEGAENEATEPIGNIVEDNLNATQQEALDKATAAYPGIVSMLKFVIAPEYTALSDAKKQYAALGGDEADFRQSMESDPDDTLSDYLNQIGELEAALEKVEEAVTTYIGSAYQAKRSENKNTIETLEAKIASMATNVKGARDYLLKTNVSEFVPVLWTTLPGYTPEKGKAAAKSTVPQRLRNISFSVSRDGESLGTFDSAALAAIKVRKDSGDESITTDTVNNAYWAVAGKDPAAYPASISFPLTAKEGKVFDLTASKRPS